MSTEVEKPVEGEIEKKGCTEDHDHDHDHDSDDGKGDNSKQNRGEKKFKKQMLKLGMKPITGINRFTIKRGKMLISVNDPEVLKSQENSYVVFGEAKINDFGGQMPTDQIPDNFDAKKAEKVEIVNDNAD